VGGSGGHLVFDGVDVLFNVGGLHDRVELVAQFVVVFAFDVDSVLLQLMDVGA